MSSINKYLHCLLLIFICGVISCSNPVNNNPPTGSLHISPTYSGADSTFYLDASACADDDNATDQLQIRIDWEGDGTWDTDWKTVKLDSHVYHADGIFNVNVEIKDTDGKLATMSEPCSVSVWRLKNGRMSLPRGYLAAGVINGKIYVCGGQYWNGTFTYDSNLLEEYDPITDIWTKKANMLTARDGLACGVINNDLYAVGGDPNGANEVYNPVTNIWVKKDSMLTANHGFAIAIINDRIHTFGGGGGGTHEEYDPVSDLWIKKADLLLDRIFLGSGVVNGKIYSIGGELLNGSITNIVEEWDPMADAWTTRAPLNINRTELSTCVIDNKIYAIGGYGCKSFEIYDVLTDTWGSLKALPFYVYAAATVVVNGHIYLIGGLVNSEFSDAVYEYIP